MVAVERNVGGEGEWDEIPIQKKINSYLCIKYNPKKRYLKLTFKHITKVDQLFNSSAPANSWIFSNEL